jgi:hypothetical protein
VQVENQKRPGIRALPSGPQQRERDQVKEKSMPATSHLPAGCVGARWDPVWKGCQENQQAGGDDITQAM